MKTFVLKRSLWLPHPIEKVFPFFSDPSHLVRITPKWLHFQNVGNGHSGMEAGVKLKHRLKVRGIPIRWVSEITEWDPPYGFVDEQKKGPYRYWRHEHIFEEKKGGTVVEDVVRYAVLGGDLVNRLFIVPDLKRIFDYRQDTLRRIFS